MEILKALEIVGDLKDMRAKVNTINGTNDIDFLGASLPYVEEKIESLIFALKDLKRYCKALDKSHKLIK